MKIICIYIYISYIYIYVYVYVCIYRCKYTLRHELNFCNKYVQTFLILILSQRKGTG